MEWINKIINDIVWVFVEAAPFLLLGLLLAGIIGRVLKREWVERHLRGNSFWSVIKAAVLGAPMPICSCGVIPTTIGLRRSGAGRGACMSFLISTPETGVDSITMTAFLINPLMTVARPVVAMISAMIGGLAAMILDRDKPAGPEQAEGEAPASCCASATSAPKAESCCGSKPAAEEKKGCCGSEAAPAKPAGLWQTIRDMLQFGFGEIMGDIAKWLLIGIVLAGVAMAVIPDDYFTSRVSHPLAQMGLMALIALPLYLCSTSTTPLAVALMLKGLSPGAALVLLTLGPATNFTTMIIIGREFGARFVALYQGTILVVAFGAGWIIHAISKVLPDNGWWDRIRVTKQELEPGLEHDYSLVGILSALALCFLLVYHLFGKQWVRRAVKAKG